MGHGGLKILLTLQLITARVFTDYLDLTLSTACHQWGCIHEHCAWRVRRIKPFTVTCLYLVCLHKLFFAVGQTNHKHKCKLYTFLQQKDVETLSFLTANNHIMWTASMISWLLGCGFTLTDVETQSWTEVSGSSAVSPSAEMRLRLIFKAACSLFVERDPNQTRPGGCRLSDGVLMSKD